MRRRKTPAPKELQVGGSKPSGGFLCFDDRAVWTLSSGDRCGPRTGRCDYQSCGQLLVVNPDNTIGCCPKLDGTRKVFDGTAPSPPLAWRRASHASPVDRHVHA